MTRIGLALAFSLAIGLTLQPGSAWARPRFHGGFPGGLHSGHGRVFVGHGPPFFHHPFIFRHHFFFHHGFIHPHYRSPFIGVHPFPRAVWGPGVWRWNGFGWVWVPGGPIW